MVIRETTGFPERIASHKVFHRSAGVFAVGSVPKGVIKTARMDIIPHRCSVTGWHPDTRGFPIDKVSQATA